MPVVFFSSDLWKILSFPKLVIKSSSCEVFIWVQTHTAQTKQELLYQILGNKPLRDLFSPELIETHLLLFPEPARDPLKLIQVKFKDLSIQIPLADKDNGWRNEDTIPRNGILADNDRETVPSFTLQGFFSLNSRWVTGSTWFIFVMSSTILSIYWSSWDCCWLLLKCIANYSVFNFFSFFIFWAFPFCTAIQKTKKVNDRCRIYRIINLAFLVSSRLVSSPTSLFLSYYSHFTPYVCFYRKRSLFFSSALFFFLVFFFNFSNSGENQVQLAQM